MQTFNIFNGLKRRKRFFDMMESWEKITKTAEHRAKIIDFFDKHGLSPTKDAFGVSRSTIYRWKKLLRDSGGRVESLNNMSRAPHSKRKSKVDQRVIEFIRNIRKEWPRLGKEKIKPLLDEYCNEQGIKTVSVSTIGRIIKKHNLYFYIRKKKIILLDKKKLRRGDYKPKEPGDLGQIDTIVLFDFGIKRYLITYVDLVSKFSFAFCYKNATSKNAEDFMRKLDSVAPFRIKRVQTDNGSEFYKNFHDYIIESGRIHFFNYPKSPQMNSYVERFNRSVEEEFVYVKDVDPYHDIDGFNRELMKYLIFYNTKRVHQSIGNMVPLSYVVKHYFKHYSPKESNMLWTCTTYNR